MINKLLSKNREIFFILLLGFVLRFYKIKERFFWGIEQSASLWPIARLFEEKKLTLIGQHVLASKGALFMSPFYIYIFALPLKIFNFNPLALELIFAAVGLLVTFLIFLAAKKIYSKNTAVISSLIYAVSFNIINSDKNTWVVTPIILTSALILFFIPKIFSKNQRFYLFVIGCLAGLGFSFHYQSIVLLITLFVVILKFFDYKKAVSFLLGVTLLLSPLIIFNLRHNFVMVRGAIKMFLSDEVVLERGQDFGSKFLSGLQTFIDLFSQIINISLGPKNLVISFFIFLCFFLLPAFASFKKSGSKTEKFVSLYFNSLIIFGIAGLMIVNPPGYPSTSFYLLFLIPPLIIIWTQFLFLLFRKNVYPLLILVLVFVLINLKSVIHQGPGNYKKVTEVVKYILSNTEKKKITVKFIGRDVLAYDYIFYYQAPFYNRSYGNLNLQEEWQECNPDFVIVHRDYDWQEDKYQISDYKKIVSFDDVKVVVLK